MTIAESNTATVPAVAPSVNDVMAIAAMKNTQIVSEPEARTTKVIVVATATAATTNSAERSHPLPCAVAMLDIYRRLYIMARPHRFCQNKLGVWLGVTFPRPIQSPPMPLRAKRVMNDTPHERALDCVRSLVRALYRSSRSVETRTGLTNAQLSILRQVARHGPLTVNDVAARVHAGQSTVSTVLSRLTRAGYVRRRQAPEDQRRVLVEVTARGRHAVLRSPRPPTERLLGALNRLSDREAEALADSLHALLSRMHVSTERAPMLFD